MKQGFKKNLAFITILILFFQIKSSESQPAFTAASAYLSAYQGQSISLICNGVNMNTDDVVWQYLIPPSTTPVQIYIDNALTISTGKYTVSSVQYAFGNISTTLTITSLDPADGSYIYQCECNTYKTCTSVQTNADINVTALATTTTTTTTTTTLLITTTEGLCLEGNYNTAQYTLVTLSVCIMMAATVLFHLSFHAFKESLMETFFMALAIVISIFCLVVGVIFWINPTIGNGSGTYASTIVVTLITGGCIILWILIIQYCIRLCIGDELSLGIVIMVCVDAFLEAFAAALVIAANVYCGGMSVFPALVGFSYSYLELIGATFLLIFSFALLLISGVVFFLKKKKNDEHVLNSFKALVSGSPLTPANFGYMAKSSHSQRPPALIQELWFPSKKVVPVNDFQPEEFNRDIMPPKPKKLTPIFSKKRSEIMQQSGSTNFTDGGASPTKKPKKKSAKNEELNTAYGASGETVTKKKSKKKSARSESETRPNENEFEVNLEEPQKKQI